MNINTGIEIIVVEIEMKDIEGNKSTGIIIGTDIEIIRKGVTMSSQILTDKPTIMTENTRK